MDIVFFIAFVFSGIVITFAIYQPMRWPVLVLGIALYLLGGWGSVVIIHHALPYAPLGAVLIMNLCHGVLIFANWLASREPLAALDTEQIHEYTN